MLVVQRHPRLQIEAVNEAAARLLQRPVSELQGLGLAGITEMDLGASLMQSPEPWEAAGVWQSGSGKSLDLRARLNPLPGPGAACTHWLIELQDRVAAQAAEEQVRRDQLLRTALESFPIPLHLATADGTLCWRNEAARRQPASEGEALSLLRRSLVVDQALEQPVSDGRALAKASPIRISEGEAPVGALAYELPAPAPHPTVDSHDPLASLAAQRCFQALSTGLAFTDATGRLQHANPAWQMLFGTASEAADGAAGDPAATLAGLTGDARLAAMAQAIGCGERTTYVGEHRLSHLHGRPGWVRFVLSRLGTEPDAGMLVQATDVDEQHAVAERVAATEARLALAQKLARVGDWQLDVATGAVACSEQATAILGAAADKFGATDCTWLRRLFEAQDWDRLQAAVDLACSHLGHFNLEAQVRRGDGAIASVMLHGIAQRPAGQLVVAGSIQDITERKQIENQLRDSKEELRHLMAHQVDIIEDERKRIAREVHDELGQLVTALRMDLSLLEAGASNPMTPLQPRLASMTATTGRMTEVVRHIAANLRPAALDLGLVPGWWRTFHCAGSWRWNCRCRRTSSPSSTSRPAWPSSARCRSRSPTLPNMRRPRTWWWSSGAKVRHSCCSWPTTGAVSTRKALGRGARGAWAWWACASGCEPSGPRCRSPATTAHASRSASPCQIRSAKTNMDTIDVIIADDHAIVRGGLRQLISTASDMRVIGEASDGWGVLELLGSHRPHVILLDLSMPGLGGLDLMRRLQDEDDVPPILVLSMHVEGQIVARVLKAGASGYITKDASPGTLLVAIRKLASGGRYIDPSLVESVVFDNSSRSDSPHELLSPRELQVLERIARGHPLGDIADELHLSPKTVSTHKMRLMQKLGLQTNADLLKYALRHGVAHD